MDHQLDAVVVGREAATQWTLTDTISFDVEGASTAEVRLTDSDPAGNTGTDVTVPAWVIIHLPALAARSGRGLGLSRAKPAMLLFRQMSLSGHAGAHPATVAQGHLDVSAARLRSAFPCSHK